jgi:hypothetical protein
LDYRTIRLNLIVQRPTRISMVILITSTFQIAGCTIAPGSDRIGRFGVVGQVISVTMRIVRVARIDHVRRHGVSTAAGPRRWASSNRSPPKDPPTARLDGPFSSAGNAVALRLAWNCAFMGVVACRVRMSQSREKYGGTTS